VLSSAVMNDDTVFETNAHDVGRHGAMSGVEVFKRNGRRVVVGAGCPLFPSLARFSVSPRYDVAGVRSKYLVSRVTKEIRPLYVWGAGIGMNDCGGVSSWADGI